MGVNRIVMQNGVVWWLPPLRPRGDEGNSPPRRPRKERPRRETPEAPRDAAAAPPAGFVPLSFLGIPGIESIMSSHADLYRDAYDRAVEDRKAAEQRPSPPDPTDPGEAPGDAHPEA